MEGGRSRKAEQLFVWLTCSPCGPCGAQVKKELKMTGDNNKNATWTLLLSLLVLIERLKVTFTTNSKLQIQVEFFSEWKISR